MSPNQVAWMLIFGRLRKQDELALFSEELTANEMLHEGLKHQFQHVPVDAPPMAILSATLNNLAYFHRQFLAVEDVESLEAAAARLMPVRCPAGRTRLQWPLWRPNPRDFPTYWS